MRQMQQPTRLARVSQNISQRASQWELGKLRINFTFQLKDRHTWLYALETLRDVGNVSLGFIIVLLFLFQGHLLPEVELSILEIVLALLGVLMVLLNAFSLVRQVWHASAWEHGLIIKNGWKPLQVIRWNEIESFCFSSRPCCIIRRQDGLEIRLKRGIFNGEELVHEVKEQVEARLLPGALAEYEAGKTLIFDKLNLNKEGLGLSGETIPWNRIKYIDYKTVNKAALLHLATNSNASGQPLQLKDVQMMLRKTRPKKGRTALRTENHLLLTPLLPNFPVALSLIEYARAHQE